jgi:hypothetical protein
MRLLLRGWEAEDVPRQACGRVALFDRQLAAERPRGRAVGILRTVTRDQRAGDDDAAEREREHHAAAGFELRQEGGVEADAEQRHGASLSRQQGGHSECLLELPEAQSVPAFASNCAASCIWPSLFNSTT